MTRLQPADARIHSSAAVSRWAIVIVLSALTFLPALLARARADSLADSDVPLTAPGGPPGMLAVAPIAPLNPMLVEGKAYLVYELSFTNFQSAPVVLDSIRADVGMGATFDFAGPAALKSMVDLSDRYAAPGNELTIAPLNNRIILLWLKFDSLQQLPHRIMHRIDYSIASADQPSAAARTMSVNTNPLEVHYQQAPMIIGPPLRGNNWLAGNAPSNTSGHRRALFVVNGNVYFPERYAIDFVQLGGDGKTYSGDAKNNHSYHAYNADILAVADGKVVAVVDRIPENVPGSTAVPISMATIGGNYVIEDIGNGAYAFYAHLIPGSIKVSVGTAVKSGQVLAHLGNSANSTEPHLHFHVISRPSPLGGDGLPYAFDHFAVVPGHANESAAEISYVFEGGAAHPVSDSLVLENAVINFP